MGDNNTEYDLALLRQIIERSDTSDLRIICYDLGHKLSIDYDIIVGEGRNRREASLLIVRFFQKRGLIPFLVERLRSEYPHEDWNNVIHTKSQPQPQYILCCTSTCSYLHGNDRFDEAFQIVYSGKPIGEYGVAIADTFNLSASHLKRVRALTIWVFDIHDFQAQKKTYALCIYSMMTLRFRS